MSNTRRMSESMRSDKKMDDKNKALLNTYYAELTQLSLLDPNHIQMAAWLCAKFLTQSVTKNEVNYKLSADAKHLLSAEQKETITDIKKELIKHGNQVFLDNSYARIEAGKIINQISKEFKKVKEDPDSDFTLLTDLSDRLNKLLKYAEINFTPNQIKILVEVGSYLNVLRSIAKLELPVTQHLEAIEASNKYIEPINFLWEKLTDPKETIAIDSDMVTILAQLYVKDKDGKFHLDQSAAGLLSEKFTPDELNTLKEIGTYIFDHPELKNEFITAIADNDVNASTGPRLK